MLSRPSLCLYRGACDVLVSKHFSSQVPRIACKRPKFNFYNKPAKKDEKIPLASDGWGHPKSKGDFFIINPLPVKDDENKPQITKSFEDIGLTEEIVKKLPIFNLKVPSEIQYKSIPHILDGKNCVIAAETGCGKTLAYLLPIIQNILLSRHFEPSAEVNCPSAIIISPTRELAQQIYSVAKQLCEVFKLKCRILGGSTKLTLKYPIFEEVDILISSLGILSKNVTHKTIKLDRVHHVVLDEADTLLDDSFNVKLLYLLQKLKFQYQLKLPPEGCHLIMASATMPKNIPESVSQIINLDSLKYIESSNLHKISPLVPQRFFRIGKSNKPLELLKLVRNDIAKRRPVMIFSNDFKTCDFVYLLLKENGIDCINFHSHMHRDQKQEKFKKYINGEVNVISCTDIGSRGLDTMKTKHVINYDFPNFIADYIHRCGRTGRLGTSAGALITNFVCEENEAKLVRKIEDSIRKHLEFPNVDGNITKILYRHTVDEDDIKTLPGIAKK